MMWFLSGRQVDVDVDYHELEAALGVVDEGCAAPTLPTGLPSVRRPGGHRWITLIT